MHILSYWIHLVKTEGHLVKNDAHSPLPSSHRIHLVKTARGLLEIFCENCEGATGWSKETVTNESVIKSLQIWFSLISGVFLGSIYWAVCVSKWHCIKTGIFGWNRQFFGVPLNLKAIFKQIRQNLKLAIYSYFFIWPCMLVHQNWFLCDPDDAAKFRCSRTEIWGFFPSEVPISKKASN